MELQFLGGTGTVTGSKFLLDQHGHRVLVDCGLFQGIKNLRERNWQPLPFSAKSLNAVVLTHAHIDHSGYLPALVKQGYHGPVYCTPGTRDLLKVMLPDAAHLQEEDAEYANRKGFSRHHPAEPLYTLKDAEKALGLLHPIPFHQHQKLGHNLDLRFSRAGHIIGSACAQFSLQEQTITFSGDVGRSHDFLMRPPEPLAATDVLVLESTYGDRLHPDIDAKLVLADIINRTVARHGTVLIPAFAVGRAQVALHLIAQLRQEKAIPDVPVYLNSPMAISATEIFYHHREDHQLSAADCQAMERGTEYTSDVNASIELVQRKGPMIVISASGMATGGRVLHHLRKVLPDERSTVLFIGYQAPGTRGHWLINGTENVKIFGEYIPVRAEIKHLDALSAHGDYRDLINWLRQMPSAPRQTYIVHGEPAASDALRLRIHDELGWAVAVPEPMQNVRLFA